MHCFDCGDTNIITVLRYWSGTASPLPSAHAVRQDGTPVPTEWGSSPLFTEKITTLQEENKNDEIKQNP